MKPRRPQAVEIEWLDAVLRGEQEAATAKELERFGGAHRCWDVGYISRMTKHEVVLAVSYDLDEAGNVAFRHSNTIPRGMIVRIRRLK